MAKFQLEIYNHRYFVNIAPSLANLVPSSDIEPISYLKGNYPNSFFFRPTNVDEIKCIISEIDSLLVGVDGVLPKLIKESDDSTLNVICNLINACISAGRFPETLKPARIMPLFKSGDRSLVEN